MTLLEMLTVLGILAVALLIMGLRTSPDRMLLVRAGNELQVFLQKNRLEAIKRNTPVVLHFEAAGIQSCLDADHTGSCSSHNHLDRWETAPYRGLQYQENLPTDLVWTPEGFPAQTGTGFAAGSIVLSKKGRTLKVILASGGRIRQEMMP
ncbi:GspH/FimT family pseudopilin [Deinococcus roseus]|uniref:GspH/FimT family pseudopilin n=1 Tax=Deinococcus roseus TaxID=392414 RepID=UPI00166A8495|nr:GspH/FimT family protein [Deinococcus roseus]